MFPGRIGIVGKQQKKTVGETVDPETLFKTLPAERHGEILDQALQVTANVSIVHVPRKNRYSW